MAFLKRAMQPTIFRKFLLVLIPSFALIAALGLATVGWLDARNDSDALGLRIGNLGARVASALGRHYEDGNRALARDFLGTFGTDGAVLCAELLPRIGSDVPLAGYPPGIGCKGMPVASILSLPVGENETVLSMHYTDAELEAAATRRAMIVFSIVLTAFLTALLSAGLAFRMIVGKRINMLHAAMTRRPVEGKRPRLAEHGRDELSEMIRAFNKMLRREDEREEGLRARNDELADEGRRDPLTGLFNRRHFDHWVTEFSALPGQRQRAGAIALIDVDHFKHINDTHGHGVGDEVLVELARRLQDTTQSEDMVVRWGGEEFLMYLAGYQDCRESAARLLGAICDTPFETSAGPLEVMASIGFARLPLRGAGFDLAVERVIVFADRALYLAKDQGRHQAVVVDGLTLKVPTQVAIVESDLLAAADHGLVNLSVVQGTVQQNSPEVEFSANPLG